jgi:two-component system, OmpR family, sensor kinase
MPADEGHHAGGAALLCDRDGVVLRVIHDDLGATGQVQPGRTFMTLLDAASLGKAMAFLQTVRSQGAAYDWEMNARLGQELVTLHFAGGSLGESILIAASRSRNGAARLYEELMRINNDQANALRAALKEGSLAPRTGAEQSTGAYDELARLNNELLTLQRELAKRNHELGRLNALKNQFLGMAAHDLRTPLGVILSYGQFLLDEAGQRLEGEQREFLATIISSSQFMLGLIDDLLDISQIESGELALDLQAVDPAAMAEHNVALNRLLAERKQIALHLSCQEGLPQMLLDRNKMDQVLNNLINNAIKFSQPGTVVQVTLKETPEGVLLSVRDQGPGIPPEEQDRLFQPFGRTSVRSTAGEKSTGLGLAIVRRIVEGHGGRIWVESQVGRGSSFFVLLPGADVVAEEPQESAAGEPRPAGGRHLRVLVAEDEPINQRIARRVLEKLGHEVVVAGTGREALEAWENGAFDLILMDVEMPEMGGLQAAAAIRQRERGGPVPIAAMTAHTSDAARREAREAGMGHYLTKPLDAEALRALLAAVAGGGK